jgi:hypothetical protein
MVWCFYSALSPLTFSHPHASSLKGYTYGVSETSLLESAHFVCVCVCVCVCVVLGLELRAFTLSHSTSPFL